MLGNVHVFFAAEDGDLARVQEHVTAGNVEAVDGGDWTILHVACKARHVHVVEWLIGVGANVNAPSRNGGTPLETATISRSPRCVQLLLDAGADATIANKNGSIPLHFAFNSAECAVLLIAAHPAGVKAVNKDGRTPLHRVLEDGGVDGLGDVVRLLLDAGSIVDATHDKNSVTPLYWALYRDLREVAELLLDHGAQLDRVNLSRDLKAIPEWAVSFLTRRNACRASCWAVLQLARRRSRVIGGNAHDVLRIVARMVWESRRRDDQNVRKHDDQNVRKRDKCVVF